jgi:lysozyme family protein
MADFLIAHRLRLKIEGGYSGDRPGDENDNGNWTGGVKGKGVYIGSNHGISAAILCEHLGRLATKQEMKDLSVVTAEFIYKNKFWNPMWGDKIKIQEVANAIYNDEVNFGSGSGIKIISEAAGLPVTSKMNDTLLKTINNEI